MTLVWTEDITLQFPRNLTNGHNIEHLALSHDARYIAIGYDKGVDVWDTRSTLNVREPAYHFRGSTRIHSVKWLPDRSTLIHTHAGARVYIATISAAGFATSGFRKSGAQDAAVMAAVIAEGLIAIAYSHTIEIRRHFPSALEPLKWHALGELPSPPALNGQIQGPVLVKSVHSLRSNRLIVSYTGPGIRNTLVVCWRINTKQPSLSEIEAVNDLAGIVFVLSFLFFPCS
ncbi:hypothetical protein EV361DRAFT_943216 [Lentinula raphanica]|nr:hypothetical protein EV361DRAFT_943216 [Lentinula raphanica]